VRLQLTVGSNYPVLSEYMQCRERVSIVRGPRGSAKTFSTAQRMLLQMTEQEPNPQGVRPTRMLVCRDSYTELTTTTVKDFMAVFADLGVYHQGGSGSGPPTWRSRKGLELDDGTKLQAEVIFQSSGVDDAEERIKGYQLTAAWFNELSGQRRGPWETARAGLGRYPSLVDGGVRASWRGMMADTNSFDESHWLWPLAQDPPEGWRWFHQPGGVIDTGRVKPDGTKVWAQNPKAENLANLPPGYYLDLCQGAKDSYVSVLLGNEYGFHVDGKPVHSLYIDSKHCALEPLKTEDAPLVIGMDFGRTPAAAICQYIAHVGRWHVIDEFVTDDMSAETFGPELKLKLEREYRGLPVQAWGDPSGSQRGQATDDTVFRMIRAAGIPIQKCETNNPDLRRAAVDGPLRRNCADGACAFLLSPKAKHLRKGLAGGWSYRLLRVVGAERLDEFPDKGMYSHVCEALEYALMGGGEGRAALMPASRPYQGAEYRQQYAVND